MIVPSLTLIALAVADLLRWSPEPVSKGRAVLALVGSAVATSTLAGLSNFSLLAVTVVGAMTLLIVMIWLSFDYTTTRSRPGYPLAWVLAVLISSFAASGLGDPIAGPLLRWYSDLPFEFVRSVSVDELLLGIGSALFMLATANRVVRLILEAAGTPATDGEAALSGGRLLGPMERLFVGAMIVSGDLTGAAVVIAAKGLLRLPEIRSSADESRGADDQVTEYFLIGTFSSLLIAGALATLVSASG